MDASQCIAQLFRRHSVDIRTLFSLDVSNRKQTYADSHTTAYEPIAVDVSLPSGPIDKTQVTPVDPADTTPGNAFLSGGLAVDDCGNVFAGVQNDIIRLDVNLNTQATINAGGNDVKIAKYSTREFLLRLCYIATNAMLYHNGDLII